MKKETRSKINREEERVRRRRVRERENTGIWDKTLTVGESPTKGRGQHLIAQFLYLFYTFKNFQNKNWEGWTLKQNL